MSVPEDIQAFLEKFYLELEGTERVAVIFTPLELEQLNNLLDLGMHSRKSHLMKEARKEGRKLNKWERHLLKADRNLWQKIRDGEKTAFGESCDCHSRNVLHPTNDKFINNKRIL